MLYNLRTIFSKSNTNLALTNGQMKSMTKALHPQPLLQFNLFDNVAAIVVLWHSLQMACFCCSSDLLNPNHVQITEPLFFFLLTK